MQALKEELERVQAVKEKLKTKTIKVRKECEELRGVNVATTEALERETKRGQKEEWSRNKWLKAWMQELAWLPKIKTSSEEEAETPEESKVVQALKEELERVQVSQRALLRASEARLTGAFSKGGKMRGVATDVYLWKTSEKPKEADQNENSKFGSCIYA